MEEKQFNQPLLSIAYIQNQVFSIIKQAHRFSKAQPTRAEVIDQLDQIIFNIININ